MLQGLTQLVQSSGTMFSIFFLIGLVCVASFVGAGYWLFNRRGSPSPYTGHVMRKGTELLFPELQRLHAYLETMEDDDNLFFDVGRAAVCPVTGRVFPDSVGACGIVHAGWSFLRRRCPGEWISWGCLTEEEKKHVLARHGSLEGYQLGFSSPDPDPRRFDTALALKKPGPLYVDLATKTLLGWKIVPESDLEVMVVTRPQ